MSPPNTSPEAKTSAADSKPSALRAAEWANHPTVSFMMARKALTAIPTIAICRARCMIGLKGWLEWPDCSLNIIEALGAGTRAGIGCGDVVLRFPRGVGFGSELHSLLVGRNGEVVAVLEVI